MLVKRLVLAAAAGAVVLGASALVFDNLAQSPVQPDAGNEITLDANQETPGARAVEKSAEGAPVPSGRESTEADADSGSGPEDVAKGTDNAAEGIEDATGSNGTEDRPFLEVLPPAAATPTGLPMPSPPPALVSAPLPEPASATGNVVAGFPTHVLSFPDTTAILFTGVSSSGDMLQATAEGIAARSPEEVAGHFQQVLLTSGFHSGEAAAAAGEHSLRFTRGPDSVSISISVTETGTRFSLLGNFRTEPGL